MRNLVLLLMAWSLGVPAFAQVSPVQLTMEPVSKKKVKQGDTWHEGGIHYFARDQVEASRTLRITVRNNTRQPIEDITIRWGVAKVHMGGSGHGSPVVYGGEETLSLRAQETKVIETETIEARGQVSQLTDRRYGEKIFGHGAQVLVGGKVVCEEYVPSTLKADFQNLRIDALSVTAVSPAEPAVLKINEPLKVTVHYRLDAADTALIWVWPRTDGKYSYAPSSTLQKGSGDVERWFTLPNPGAVNEFAVRMVDGKTRIEIKTITVPVKAQWR
jgi:hypothetical protein